MIRIGLVDDDKEHQKLIRQFICRYEKEEQTKICVKEYSDGLQFLEEYEGNLDVVFLDIEMPHMDGMTAARKLREKDTGIKIIFVTNMAQYAIHGYEVDAVDFIVKPISYYVFVDKLKKALRYLNLNKEKMVVVHGNGEMMRIGSSQILYVEKDKNYLVFLYRKFLKSSEIVYNRLEIKNDIAKERRGLRHDVVYEVFCFGLG